LSTPPSYALILSRSKDEALVPRAPVQIFPLLGIPEIGPGDNLGRLIADAARAADMRIADGDVFVIAQKIVSKAEGRIVRLDSIAPLPRAAKWATRWHKDPRVIELVLTESKRIVRMERGIIISETQHGFVCANAGVDVSNAEDGTAILLPEDPDASARALQSALSQTFHVHLAVIVSDTFGRAWREGLVNVALGVAGIAPLVDYRGERDSSGKVLQASIIAAADEIASAAELVTGKSDGTPVAVVRGIAPQSRGGSGRDLIRPPERDLFR
jgi:coenzyme F420-0:L-glutamate ligase / coenzyme F420-1:gamma-L-glutamate ligase